MFKSSPHLPYDLKVSPLVCWMPMNLPLFFYQCLSLSQNPHYVFVIHTVFATIDQIMLLHVLMHLMRYSVSFQSSAHGLRTHILRNQFHQRIRVVWSALANKQPTNLIASIIDHNTNQNNNIYQLKCELVDAVFFYSVNFHFNFNS